MDPLTIGIALLQFVPSLVKYFTGNDKDVTIAQKAIDIATQVTGKPTGDEALKALQADPNLVLQYRQAVLLQEVSFEQLAVQNASDINKTMQSESASEHWPTYSWRPAIGFSVAFNLIISSLLVLMVFGAVVLGSKEASTAVGQLPMVLGALAALIGIAAPILGIASWYRGKMQADPNIPTNNKG